MPIDTRSPGTTINDRYQESHDDMFGNLGIWFADVHITKDRGGSFNEYTD